MPGFFDRPHIFLPFHLSTFDVTDIAVKKGVRRIIQKRLICVLEVVEDFGTVSHGGRLEGWYCLRWTGFSLHLTPKNAQMTSYLTKLDSSRQWNDKEADKLSVTTDSC